MRSNKYKKYKPRFFPFSAGIPWKIERGKYIIPSIDRETWHKVLDDKNIIITVFGSYLESYFSLSVAEMFGSIYPKRKIYWLGNPEYEPLLRLQGVCKPCKINLTKKNLEQYPAPIFFDKKNNAYFNILNNYLVRKSYWGLYPEKVDTPVLKQMFDNAMIPWNSYLPKMRNLGMDYFEGLVRTARLKERSRIITIVLNEKQEDCLNWNIQNIKEFSQLIYSKGFRLIVFSKCSNLFYGTNIIPVDFDIRKILQIISKSWMVLSNDISFLFITLMASKSKIIGPSLQGAMNLLANAEFIGVDNDIFTSSGWISPLEAYTICEGIL